MPIDDIRTPRPTPPQSVEKQESEDGDLLEIDEDSINQDGDDDDDSLEIDEASIKPDEEEFKIDSLPIPTPTPTPTPSDDEEEKTIKGGAGDELENDITGMKLSNPNPFEKRLHQLDPKLYLVKQQGKYKAYSRLCPSNLRRQPVILTDEEKKRIERETGKVYQDDDAIKYGSSKDKEYWYTCPRYWCLLNSMPLTEEDVKAGKCGGKVIPFGAKKVPKDAYIYEFKGRGSQAPQIDKKTGNYIKMYPAFNKDDSHPDGLCVPCCFNSLGKGESAVKKWRDECLNKAAEKSKKFTIAKKKTKIRKSAVEEREYIKGPDKMPLEITRWGFIPISLEKFFSFDNKKIKGENNTVKKYETCILRKGVEFSNYQSFIACINDILFDSDKSIIEMKEIMIEALTLDNFVTLHNGNLISIFYDESIKVDTELYANSKYYKSIDIANEKQLYLLNKTIKSLENFKNYLRRDDITIDHTYLWDLITNPNDKLFVNGCNMIILESTNDDITNNINVLCPTSYYSNHIFETTLSTFFLYKNDDYYEPLYLYKDLDTEVKTSKSFTFRDKNIFPNIKKAILFVKDLYDVQCKPKKSVSDEIYKFKENLTSFEIITKLKDHEFIINLQIVNYNGKVIGLSATKDGLDGFVPTRPSSLIIDIPYKFMDSIDIWNDYSNTKQFLTLTAKKGIPCKPLYKVLEDGLIVGILTETNQFVMINRPTENIYNDELTAISDNNHVMVDAEIATLKGNDKERESYIKKIKMETNFYNVFRITIKLLLNDPANYKYREEIDNFIKDDELYTNKMALIIKTLKELTKFHIRFIEDTDDKIEDFIDEIGVCYNSPDCDDKKFCLTDNNNCMIIIPKKHLINKVDNEKIYYGRLADELLRYKFIRDFLLKPQVYLSLKKIGYNLKENEIILIDTLLTQEYFEKLVAKKDNFYTKNNVFDDIQPNTSLTYDNNVSLLKEKAVSSECTVTLPTIKSKILAKNFTKDSFEIVYNNSELCTFQLFIDIIKDYNDKDVDINDLKTVLNNEYSKISPSHILYPIFTEQGKGDLFKLSLQNSHNLEDIIISDHYYLTNLDLWILSEYYKLPVMIVATTKLKENNQLILILNDVDGETFYVIKQPTVKNNIIPKYSMIRTNQSMSIKKMRLPDMGKKVTDFGLANYQNQYPDYKSWIKTKQINRRNTKVKR